MLRAIFIVTMLGCLPAFGQGLGLNNDVQDCPIEYLGQVGNLHQYRARSCGNPSFVVLALSPKKVECPVGCNGLVCEDSIYGTGLGKSGPTDESITAFGIAQPPWQSWGELVREVMDSQKACSPSLTIDAIRRLERCDLTPAKPYKAEFDKLKESIPQFLKDFLAMKTRAAQNASVAKFSARMNSILSVSIPAKEGFSNPFRLCDYPTQKDLTSEVVVRGPNEKDNTGKYTRSPDDVTVKDVGIVKVVDGDQTFFFHLAMTDVKSSNGMHPLATLRTGVQVPPTDEEVKTAKFVGMNCWTHKVEVDGQLYLVTSKDKRSAATR